MLKGRTSEARFPSEREAIQHIGYFEQDETKHIVAGSYRTKLRPQVATLVIHPRYIDGIETQRRIVFILPTPVGKQSRLITTQQQIVKIGKPVVCYIVYIICKQYSVICFQTDHYLRSNSKRDSSGQRYSGLHQIVGSRSVFLIRQILSSSPYLL